MKTLLILLALSGGNDTSPAAGIVVQHEGRTKPLDTFARQLMQFLTEKENFSGYTDPKTGQRVEVFAGGDPVGAILKIISQPAEIRSLRFIKITHPGLKKTFGLPEDLTYYSLADLEPSREKFMAEARKIDRDEATSDQRAVLKIINQFMTIEAIYQERLLTIIPVPFGENRSWMTPVDVRRWLAGETSSEGRSQAVKSALDEFAASTPQGRERLKGVVDAYATALQRYAAGDASAFGALADSLRSLNPAAYPDASRIETELRYNRVRPFHWASGVYFLSCLAFLMAMVFNSRPVWIGALAVHVVALAFTGYGYGLRWIIAGRYPLSNHYESMVMCALGAGIVALFLEFSLKTKRYAGLCGGVAACFLLVLANNVPTFAEQGFVAPLVPALQTVWMTIHVPVIMTGYAMGMLLAVLGHIYLVRYLLSKTDGDFDKSIDGVMYWILKLAVLFLLIGISLGAVWAGEAWGRPWGWDMKETWALITLLSYLAVLHARFLGVLRPFGTALCSLGAFQILILTYYGVNFLFGKGLHTYGFGSGDWKYLGGFAALEAILAGAAIAARLKRGGGGGIHESHNMPFADEAKPESASQP